MLTWSVNEITRIFDSKQTTVRGWIEHGKLKGSIVSPGEGYRVRMDDLMIFMNSRPDCYEKFVYKLTHEILIGDKLSREVAEYCRRKGYLK